MEYIITKNVSKNGNVNYKGFQKDSKRITGLPNE
jgi:hypothetical protein